MALEVGDPRSRLCATCSRLYRGYIYVGVCYSLRYTAPRCQIICATSCNPPLRMSTTGGRIYEDFNT